MSNDPFELDIDTLRRISQERLDAVEQQLSEAKQMRTDISQQISFLSAERTRLKRVVTGLTPPKPRAQRPVPVEDHPVTKSYADGNAASVPQVIGEAPEGYEPDPAPAHGIPVEMTEQGKRWAEWLASQDDQSEPEFTELHVSHRVDGQVIAWETDPGRPPEVTADDLAPIDVRGIPDPSLPTAPPFRPE